MWGKKTYYKSQKGLNVQDKGNCSHWRNQAFPLVSHRKPALRSSGWWFYQRADGKVNGFSVYQVTISFWRINFQAVSPCWSQPCISIITMPTGDAQSTSLFFCLFVLAWVGSVHRAASGLGPASRLEWKWTPGPGQRSWVWGPAMLLSEWPWTRCLFNLRSLTPFCIISKSPSFL